MLWQVPVTIATSKNPAAVKFVLDSQSTTITVEGVGPEDWILVRNNYIKSLPRVSHKFQCMYILYSPMSKPKYTYKHRYDTVRERQKLIAASSLCALL